MSDFNREDKYAIAKQDVAQAFSAAAKAYDEHAFLQREIADRLMERLDLIKLEPKLIVDVGSGTGYCTRALQTRYKKASVYGVDIAPGMVEYANKKRGWFAKEKYLCADARQLPFEHQSVDLIFSSLALQWTDDIDNVFAEFQRVLKPEGLLLFSTFGPDTLKELRHAWSTVDDRVHVNRFMDMHDVGDALVRNFFADPVMDMEMLTLTYRDIMQLMRELKGIGANNRNAGRSHSLTTPKQLRQMMSAYEQAFRREDQTLPVSYEVVYGHAWGTELKARQTAPQEFAMPVSQIPIRRAKPE
ncbi:malonyl-ACP O-methyltransferase BioC [Permianibacter aggregans]|uniref:Malonyl-[acyl-carrier protein] O-methyltransferase n=1 Tax=Permianibacter aggregans TaxID=1510150 RepID=A0A4R6UQN7_9GAMM|nr:malonyl-ACP O-methyltransferase BioC [Permianibacter aggregans]QGX40504.1 malonyl-[acyl-carrier protein] O-methyltransferase BioC [Permianibacter aggregans]TDQ49351.1 malonyl-CoA O-methyltransferase [Permianibacter aggregans]